MDYVTLGRTGIVVNKNGFGALPIQRIDREEAANILNKAYDQGVRLFDTARKYTDSEEKLGYALSSVRDQIYITTKTDAKDAESFWKDLEESLRRLKTDYIDIYQFHNPPFCPKPGGKDGLYDAMLEAKRQGKIRYIGITNHRLSVAREAIESGLYDTLQFPFSYLSTQKEMELVEKCRKENIGFLAMKALAGGLINCSEMAYAFMNQFDHVLPIWGIQRECELDEFVSYQDNPPRIEGEIAERIEKDKRELQGEFCRGCGYCMPCPAGIEINNCARMSLLLRRSPSAAHLNEKTQEKMRKIEDCMECGQCRSKCPYGLNTPELLKKNYIDYQEILAGKQF
ncbi:MAG: aldo/keto reductase [Dorea sp.]